MAFFDNAVTSEQVVSAFAPQVKGRVFVITGAGQPSIGSSIAVELAKASPSHILIASRTAENVYPVLSAIREEDTSVKATFVPVDLSDHDSVLRAAQEILAATRSQIDVLINSAGNMALKEYTVDKQGIEMQMSVNHVGHFLLTNLLKPALLAGAANPYGARVINITSVGYQISPVRYGDVSFSSGKAYDMWAGYGQAKTAQILFSYGLTDRLKHRGVVAFACHPGSNLDTKLGSHLVMDDYSGIMPVTQRNTGQDFVFTVGDEPRFKTYEQIGATPLIAALDPGLATRAPAYLQNGQIMQPTAQHALYNAIEVEKCWKLSEKLVGQSFMY
ncbi:putative oxidoreductase [Triangularia setosa]|uniref:Oxidoreductase n=1 Tax=Triangularia setosa TaxID=2587417 RepID=A0AAN6W3T4_9PEZI|nr:putative oxidoreductase [Podospora setosa]